MSEYVTAYGGAQIPISDLAVAIGGYNGNGDPTTLTYVFQGITYIQTITYSGTQVTNVSQLIPQ